MATTGERIRDARKAHGMTQKELAEKIGVKFSAIHKYETGLVVNLKRETISALAKALDVSPSWLMCIDEEKNAAPLVNGDSDLTSYLELLRTRPEMRALLDTAVGATKEEVEENVRFIEALRHAKKAD